MFKSIVAVDVASRIPNFFSRTSEISLAPPLVLKKADPSWLSDEFSKTADCLLVSIYQDVDETFLRMLPNLRYVGVLGTSSKKIDTDYCQKNNIKISVVKEYCDEETAEWVILQILKFYRQRAEPRSAFGKSLGIIGFGSVGKKLAHKAAGLGLKVLVNTLSSEVGSYEQASKAHIFAHCDIVSFHTPPHGAWLLPEELRHVKAHSLLINTCMGIVDKDDTLETTLRTRPDVTLVMDQIAAASYPHLRVLAHIEKECAYETLDASERLIKRFFERLNERI